MSVLLFLKIFLVINLRGYAHLIFLGHNFRLYLLVEITTAWSIESWPEGYSTVGHRSSVGALNPLSLNITSLLSKKKDQLSPELPNIVVIVLSPFIRPGISDHEELKEALFGSFIGSVDSSGVSSIWRSQDLEKRQNESCTPVTSSFNDEELQNLSGVLFIQWSEDLKNHGVFAINPEAKMEFPKTLCDILKQQGFEELLA